MTTPTLCKGYCKKCNVHHSLHGGNSFHYARTLMEELTKHQRIDYRVETKDANPLNSTSSLFGNARGKMFGVMECRDTKGKTVILQAFSGQYNGQWLVDGWVPPLFSVQEFNMLNIPMEKRIKNLTSILQHRGNNTEQMQLIRDERKKLSQQLMLQLHKLYQLHNFCGSKVSLQKAFIRDSGIPSGVGDCCAPKLLNYAAKKDFTPIGLTEFYWGKQNKSNTKFHGIQYPSCTEKCEPILGFLLCGIER